MGHDLYIQARIREKRTERVISCGDSDDYAAQEDIGFFHMRFYRAGASIPSQASDSERICPPENNSNLPHAHKRHAALMAERG